MSPPFTVQELILSARKRGLEDFAAPLAPLVLLGEPSGSQSSPDDDHWSYATRVGRPTTNPPPAIERDGLVWPVRKRARLINRFVHVVLVGRASSNDICIDDANLSKLHVRILTKTEPYQVADAGSSNGTWLNGEKLVPKEPVPLADGDNLALANHRFLVYGVERLHRVLKLMVPLDTID